MTDKTVRKFFCIVIQTSILLGGIVKGQPYIFKVQNDAYSNLDSTLSSSLTSGLVWEDEQFLAPIGFNFQIAGESFDSVKVLSDGEITFYQSCGILHFPQGRVLMAFFADLEDRGSFVGNGTTALSPISYVTMGLPGNRIFKLEWKNASFWGGSGYNDFVNFQIWLYESGNILVEIRFGSSNITDPTDIETWGFDVLGPIVNFNFEEDCDTTTAPLSQVIIGNPNAPVDTIVTGNIEVALSQVTINNVPNEGIVYQFLKSAVSTNDFNKEDWMKIYPTPSDGMLNVEVGSINQAKWSAEVFDLLGRKRFRLDNLLNSNENKAAIDLSWLNAGIYFFRLTSDADTITKTFELR